MLCTGFFCCALIFTFSKAVCIWWCSWCLSSNIPRLEIFYCTAKLHHPDRTVCFLIVCSIFIFFSSISSPLSCPFLALQLTPVIPVIGGVLFLFVLGTLLRTSFSDPGVLPRATPDEAADLERQIGKATLYLNDFSHEIRIWKPIIDPHPMSFILIVSLYILWPPLILLIVYFVC